MHVEKIELLNDKDIGFIVVFYTLSNVNKNMAPNHFS